MNRDEFIKAYVAAFLGSWAANQYEHLRPNWQREILKPPVEDAVFQAEQSWEHCAEIEPKFFK